MLRFVLLALFFLAALGVARIATRPPGDRLTLYHRLGLTFLLAVFLGVLSFGLESR